MKMGPWVPCLPCPVHSAMMMKGLSAPKRCVLDMTMMVILATSRLLLCRPWIVAAGSGHQYQYHRFGHHPQVFIITAVLSLVVKALELSQFASSPDSTRSRMFTRYRTGLAHIFLSAGFALVWYDTFHDLMGRMVHQHPAHHLSSFHGARTLLSSCWMFFATNGMERNDGAVRAADD